MSVLNQKVTDHTMHVLAELSDEKQATKSMKEHAALEWSCDSGAKLRVAKQKHDTVETSFVSGNDALLELDKRLSKTDVLVPKKKPKAAKDEEPEPWSKYDLVLFGSAIAGGVSAAVMGSENLYANMMASMSPIFLETPSLARSLSFLLPLGSLALKFASGYFPTNKSQKRYELTVFISSAISLGVWACLFAQTYPGVAAPLDMDSLLSGSQGGSSLVLMQLLVELLVGSSLWIAANGIYRKNQPDYLDDNPQYTALLKTVNKQREAVKTLGMEYGICQAEVSELEAQRDLYVRQRLAKFSVLRSHLQAARTQF